MVAMMVVMMVAVLDLMMVGKMAAKLDYLMVGMMVVMTVD